MHPSADLAPFISIAWVLQSPTWMIRRYRIQEAAARLEAGDVHSWSDLALDLGYADQSHFSNDFRRFVGRPPATYARSLERLAMR